MSNLFPNFEPAARPQPAGPRPPNLKVFAPAESGNAQDASSCAFPSAAPEPPAEPAPDLRILFREVQQQHADRRIEIPVSERERIRESCSLWEVWDTWIRPDREHQLQTGKITNDTHAKDRQVLNQFAVWEQTQRPESWPSGVDWKGLPVAYLTAPYIEAFLTSQARDGLRYGTIKGRCGHLHTNLNLLVRMKLLEVAPLADLESAWAKADSDDDDDDAITTYTLAELERIYLALPRVDLQVAWILGATIGPRTRDLFLLRWEDCKLDREIPHIQYKAHKTGKVHQCPLPACVVHQLERLRRQQLFATGPLFPGLSSPNAKSPEKSTPARRRTDWIKQALRVVGLPCDKGDDYELPIQVLRKTASTRLNNHQPGTRAGRLMTHGPDCDVNSQHYDYYLPRLAEAVTTLSQPPAFEQRAF